MTFWQRVSKQNKGGIYQCQIRRTIKGKQGAILIYNLRKGHMHLDVRQI